MPKLKKLLISFLAGIIFLMSLAPAIPTQAQTTRHSTSSDLGGTQQTTTAAPSGGDTWFSSGFGGWFTKVYGGDQTEIFGERYTAAQVQWVFYGFMSMLANAVLPSSFWVCIFSGNAGNCATASSSLPDKAKLSGVEKITNTSLVSLVFSDRPMSGITYVKNIFRKFHVIPEANAASVGTGYQALNMIQPLWSAARNMAYGLFVFVIIIMAFLIMFRVKISPQVVVSVQSALPKIAIALILITFSYAIAGFLIDMMYVVIGLISLILGSVAGGNSAQIFNNMTNPPGGLLGLFTYYLILSLGAFAEITRAVFSSSGLAGIGAALLLAVVFVVLIIVTVFNAFKVAWLLLRTFVNVFLLTVIAPLQFAFGTVAANLSFSSWVKSFAANLAVFPLVGTMFSLSYMFLAAVIQNVLPGGTFLGVDYSVYAANSLLIGSSTASSPSGWPPLVGISVGGGTQNLLWLYAVISIVLYFMIPKAADIIKTLIEGKPFAFGTAIGEAIGPATGLGRAAIAKDISDYESTIGPGGTPGTSTRGSVLRTLGIIKK